MNMDSRRILVTGLSTYWGGRLAQALEAFPDIEAVIGVDSEEPQVELERTEYVKVGAQHALLRRVVEAAEIDTVVDTRLVTDSSRTTPSKAHENNVIGTMNILAACSGAGSPVRKFLFKSSTHYYGCEQDDPAFFDETMVRPHEPRTPIERDIVEAEASVNEFAEKNPGCAVTMLRFANVLGPSVRTSHIELFSLPAVPMILGFDPRYQFVHEDDVVHGLEHAVKQAIPGLYNVATGRATTFNEVIRTLNDALGTAHEPDYFENPYPFYQDYTCADLTATEEGLGWQPHYTTAEGIAEYVPYLRERYGLGAAGSLAEKAAP
jgi:UDP-glucose 4-epimerase